MRSEVRLFVALAAALAVTGFIAIAILFVRFHVGASQVEREWSLRKIAPVSFERSARSLSVTPLVNWHTRDSRFATEPGVSLLIETDEQTILFDVGFNREESGRSPLEKNIELVGRDLRDVETIFLSHRHRDHMGGIDAEREGRLAIDPTLIDKNIVVLAPVALPAEERPVTEVLLPSIVGPGIASTGPIARQLFMGRIDEQALVINLEGRGLVVVVGCGHQTVKKLVKRIEETFDQPIYAMVGDFHFPVPKGRLSFFGVDAQRYLASGDGPLAPVGWREVDEFANWASANDVQLVLGGHDTSDDVLNALAARPDITFMPLRVGERRCLSC